MESRKHKIAVLLAKYSLRSGRGGGLVAKFTDIIRDILQGTVYIFSIKGLTGYEINPNHLLWIVIFKLIIEYIAGYLYEITKFWAIENAYSSDNLNPFNQELMALSKRNESKIDTLITDLKYIKGKLTETGR